MKMHHPDEFNILFTCAGRRVALLQAFRDAMVELGLSGRIVAADITMTAPACHAADACVTVPRTDDEQYIPALLDIVRRYGIRLLAPMTDLDILLLARQREQFEQLGCTVMVGSEDAVMLCRDKALTSDIVAQAGLANLKTLRLEEFQTRPFYPCFIKPVSGSAGVGSALLHDDAELRLHLGRYSGDMIVQEYAPGREYTIDVYRTRDGKVRCVVPRQRLAVRSGEVEKGVTVKNAEIIDVTIRLCGFLKDLWGVFCCQCRWMPNGPMRFFEINPRFGGGAPLSIAAGANLPLYLLQEVTGQEVTAQVGRFTENLLMMRYDEAYFVPVDKPGDLPGFNEPQFR